MTKLFKKKCIACSGDMSALKEDTMKELNNQIQNQARKCWPADRIFRQIEGRFHLFYKYGG